MNSTFSQPQQDSKELSQDLSVHLGGYFQEAVDYIEILFSVEEEASELEKQALKLKRDEFIQKALDEFKRIDQCPEETKSETKIEETKYETLKSGKIEYAIAYDKLDKGDANSAKTWWLEAEKSAKRYGDKTTHELKCKGRLIVLDIYHFKNMGEGKRMAEELSKKYPGFTFFAIIKALAQETEDEFQTEFSRIPDYVMKKLNKKHLELFKRDLERAKEMLDNGDDEEHWEKIVGRHQVIVKKIEDVVSSKEKAEKESGTDKEHHVENMKNPKESPKKESGKSSWRSDRTSAK